MNHSFGTATFGRISRLVLVILIVGTFVSPGFCVESSGQIVVTVVNASQGDRPVPGAEVLLRAGDNQGVIPIAQGVTDENGQFRFEGLPLDEQLIFLPGANRNEIHYPGPRIRLAENLARQMVRLAVYDASEGPSPLETKSHSIVVRAETGLLKVSETLVVSNPSNYSYVGDGAAANDAPATLRLNIPSDFLKVTFNEEFFGRQFHLVDGALQTEIPWVPGEKKIELTYYLPFETGRLSLRRVLELPSQNVSVSVYRAGIERIECNLTSVPSASDAQASYSSDGRQLPAGHVLAIDLGGLPLPVMAYARWAAAVLLATMIALTIVAQRQGWRFRGRPWRAMRPSASHGT